MVVDLAKLGMTQEEFDALSEEEQKKLAEQAPLPAQESETEKEIRGLLTDLKKERERRSTSEEKAAELEGRIEDLEGRLEEATKKREEESTENDTEMLTVGEAKKVISETLSKREAEYDKRIGGLSLKIDTVVLKLSEDAVKEKYSPEKVGADLCYDKVIDEGFAKLVKENPAYKVVVANSANPGEEAYKIGLTHPDFQALLKTETAKGVIDKLGTTKVKTGIGSSQGSTGFDVSKASISDLLKLSKEDLDKLARTT